MLGAPGFLKIGILMFFSFFIIVEELSLYQGWYLRYKIRRYFGSIVSTIRYSLNNSMLSLGNRVR